MTRCLTQQQIIERIDKKAAMKMITIAGTSPMPKRRTINGIQAVGEIGRRS